MKIEAITDDLASELLASPEEKPKAEPRPRPIQVGPLRFFDTEFRCASRGCGSSTRWKVCGIPRCVVHALRELNDMLHALGVER